MSDACLVANLVKIGLAAEDIEKLDHMGLMETYAKAALEGKDKSDKAAKPQKVTVHIELKRERLAFKKFKSEQAQRAAENAEEQAEKQLELENYFNYRPMKYLVMERYKEMELRLATEKLSREEENLVAALFKKLEAALRYTLSPMDDKNKN